MEILVRIPSKTPKDTEKWIFEKLNLMKVIYEKTWRPYHNVALDTRCWLYWMHLDIWNFWHFSCLQLLLFLLKVCMNCFQISREISVTYCLFEVYNNQNKDTDLYPMFKAFWIRCKMKWIHLIILTTCEQQTFILRLSDIVINYNLEPRPCRSKQEFVT